MKWSSVLPLSIPRVTPTPLNPSHLPLPQLLYRKDTTDLLAAGSSLRIYEEVVQAVIYLLPSLTSGLLLLVQYPGYGPVLLLCEI